MESNTRHLVYRGNCTTPKYQTLYSAGFDLTTDEGVTLLPGIPSIIPTGCFLEGVPTGGRYIQLAPRSSIAIKGVVLLAGIVDEDYEQEIKVVLLNLSNDVLFYGAGERIAQGLWKPVDRLEGVEESNTRRIGGFGSTNINR